MASISLAFGLPAADAQTEQNVTWGGGAGNWSIGPWMNLPAGYPFPENDALHLFNVALGSGTLTQNVVSGNAGAGEGVTVRLLTQSGGTLTLNNPLRLTHGGSMSGGTVNGGGNLRILGGAFSWTGGSKGGAGRTIIASGAALTMAGGGTKTLGRLMENFGVTSWSGPNSSAGHIQLGTGGAFINRSSGIFEATAEGTFNAPFTNEGLVTRAGSGESSWGGAFNNNGAVQVNSGVLRLSGSGAGSGSFTLAANTQLLFTDGGYRAQHGTIISGPGRAVMQNGTTIIGTADTAEVEIENFSFVGGAIQQSGLLRIARSMEWTGGLMFSTGTPLIESGATLTLGGSGSKTLAGPFENAGVTTWTGANDSSGHIFHSTGAIAGRPDAVGHFTNRSGGHFDAQSEGTFYSSFTNDGLLTRSGAGVSSFAGFVKNTGVVHVKQGGLTFNGPQQVSNALGDGTWIVDNGATLAFQWGGNLTVLTADVTLKGTAVLANIDTLAVNQGALRLLEGRNFTSAGDFDNRGTLELGGGTFTAGSLLNSGILVGSGAVAAGLQNQGVVRAESDLLTLSNEVQGTGRIELAPGAALTLNGATNSAGHLVHEGQMLTLNGNLRVDGDYENRGSGIGNAFDPRANVSGAGVILATAGAAQSLTGAVTSGDSAMVQLALGNLHEGAPARTLTYSIRQSGSSGPALRGAIQTSVNGANITDPRLSGSGVTAQNFGPIAAGQSSDALNVTFDPVTAGRLTGQAVHVMNNFANVQNQTLSISGAVYRLAKPGVIAEEPLQLGNFRVGSVAAAPLSIANIAGDTGGYTELLNASFASVSGHATAAGAVTGRAWNQPPGALQVGIDTTSAGAKSGSATVAFTSSAVNSSGLGVTGLGSQTIAVSGSVFRLAQPVISLTQDFGIVRVGDSVTRKLPISNSAPADGFSENLNAQLGTLSGGITGDGAKVTQLAPGATDTETLQVTFDTSAAGVSNQVAQLLLQSDGAGSSGLPAAPLAELFASLQLTVHDYAQPLFQLLSNAVTVRAAGPHALALDLGVFDATLNESRQIELGLRNDASGPADWLGGNFAPKAGEFSLAGWDAFDNVSAGEALRGLFISFDSAGRDSGVFSGSIQFSGFSRNSQNPEAALPRYTLSVEATVIPEPSTTLLLALGFASFAGLKRRR